MLSLLYFFFHMQSSAFAEESKFIFDQTVKVYQPSATGLGQSLSVNPGAEVKFDDSRLYWVESQGFVPLLVLPQNGNNASKEALKVKLPEVSAWPSPTTDKVLGEKLGALMEELNKFQTALRGKHIADAEQSYQHMTQIADIEYLQFFKASLRFAQGDMAAAKEAVTRGLQHYPNNEQGQKFLKSLERGGQ